MSPSLMQGGDFTALEGAAVLVTGASGGIGSEVVRELARVGACPWLHYRSQRRAASELATEMGLDDSVLLGADLRVEEDVDEMFSAIARRGRLSGLVVNAGIWEPATVPLRDMALEQWRSTMASNLESAFLCCREFLRQLDSEQVPAPSIVLVGSTSGVFGEEGHADYSASKAAMQGLTLTLKNEIVRIHARGRVNLVNPGWVATPMAAEAIQDKKVVERVTATMPLQKVATAQDVASTIVYLLSERLAGHVSGEAITVAGGMEGRLLHPP